MDLLQDPNSPAIAKVGLGIFTLSLFALLCVFRYLKKKD